MSARATALLAALALVACGGSSGTGSTLPRSRERPSYSACDDAAAVRLAPTVCWNPTGSHWHFAAEAPGGSYSFEVELMAAGRVRASDVPNASPAVDEWFVENDELRVFLQNRYVEYRATMHNGTLMLGEAVNARGDVWSFRADRVHEGSTCPASEIATSSGDEPGCFGVAGTRWTVQANGAEYEIQFADGGVLLSNRPTDTTADDDGWEQDGASVRLWFDNHATELTANISPSDLTQLSGSGWRATAIPTYPPPIH